jgi:uncharacterized protein YaiE (UPF0345 family)
LHAEFVNGVVEQQDFVSSLDQALDVGVLQEGFLVFTSEEVNGILAVLGSLEVVVEGGKFVLVVGGVPSGEFSESVSVGSVFDDTELDVLSELLEEAVVLLCGLLLLLFGGGFVVFGDFLF